jgi:hypothetical protein
MNYELPVIDSNIEEVSLPNITGKIVDIEKSVLDTAVLEIVKLDVCSIVFDGVNNSDCK